MESSWLAALTAGENLQQLNKWLSTSKCLHQWMGPLPHWLCVNLHRAIKQYKWPRGEKTADIGKWCLQPILPIIWRCCPVKTCPLLCIHQHCSHQLSLSSSLPLPPPPYSWIRWRWCSSICVPLSYRTCSSTRYHGAWIHYWLEMCIIFEYCQHLHDNQWLTQHSFHSLS